MDTAKCTHFLALADRCLREPPSRRLDAEIYCAVLDEVDVNTPGGDRQLTAVRDGEVLLVKRGTTDTEWYVSPPYTSELRYANLLLPENVLTITREARQVYSIALRAAVAAFPSDTRPRALVMIG
jgi:hypothetical protein